MDAGFWVSEDVALPLCASAVQMVVLLLTPLPICPRSAQLMGKHTPEVSQRQACWLTRFRHLPRARWAVAFEWPLCQ